MRTPTPWSSQVGALLAGSAPFTEEQLGSHHSGLNPAPLSAFSLVVVITLVFLTLLTVLVVIIIYLYRNKGSYLTYEQPAAETDVSVQMEDAPSKEKEEYFI